MVVHAVNRCGAEAETRHQAVHGRSLEPAHTCWLRRGFRERPCRSATDRPGCYIRCYTPTFDADVASEKLVGTPPVGESS